MPQELPAKIVIGGSAVALAVGLTNFNINVRMLLLLSWVRSIDWRLRPSAILGKNDDSFRADNDSKAAVQEVKQGDEPPRIVWHVILSFLVCECTWILAEAVVDCWQKWDLESRVQIVVSLIGFLVSVRYCIGEAWGLFVDYVKN
uniref:ARAD1C33110p n=1 Tax=Blastobotrys adeninivorans TaxID=409370 RepID=A0A060T8X3_BLAAD